MIDFSNDTLIYMCCIEGLDSYFNGGNNEFIYINNYLTI